MNTLVNTDAEFNSVFSFLGIRLTLVRAAGLETGSGLEPSLMEH